MAAITALQVKASRPAASIAGRRVAPPGQGVCGADGSRCTGGRPGRRRPAPRRRRCRCGRGCRFPRLAQRRPVACAAGSGARGGRARRQFAVTGARQATSYGSQGARHAPITGCRPHAARVRDRLRSTPACAGLPPSAGLFIGRPGSIPACAGLPSVRAGASCAMAVYPTCAGCHVHPHTEPGIVEATPTCAGLLRRRTRVASGRWSHPRVCGAAPGCLAHEWFHAGLPPRVHGATADPRVRGAAGVQKVLPRRRQSVSPRARGCRG